MGCGGRDLSAKTLLRERGAYVIHGRVVVHDNTYGAALAHVVDVPLGVPGVRCVARGGQVEDRVVVVCAEAAVVDHPDLVPCFIRGPAEV